MNEKIKAHHLQRKAILYVRQSSVYQVNHNQESRQLQYAMQVRLRQLGWCEIEVIDEDLGRSAAGTVQRAGFERLVVAVSLGQVGAVAAREVSRFARNNREWQQLVEVCRVVDTLLIDQEAIYTPRQGNDRLLLGLKGSLNEYELDLLRERSVEARREKARRGELIVVAPVGFMKTEDQRLEKDPDRRVQEAIRLAFAKFLELGSVRQTLWWFIEHEVALPVRLANGETRWRRPSYSHVYRILTHPAYGGAYAYGKTEQTMHYDDGQPRRVSRRKPRDQWLALLPDAHEGYLSWEQFEHIQRMISENGTGTGKPGAAKRGLSLLAGLLRCRRCGRKLTVYYTGRDHNMLRYACRRGLLDNGEASCIAFGGTAADEVLSQQLLRVVQPGALEAALLSARDVGREQDEVLAALARDLEAARYAANRAWKQYDATDPDNRLVASELERRWNQALQRVEELERRIDQQRSQRATQITPTPEDFQTLAAANHMGVRVVQTRDNGTFLEVYNFCVGIGKPHDLVIVADRFEYAVFDCHRRCPRSGRIESCELAIHQQCTRHVDSPLPCRVAVSDWKAGPHRRYQAGGCGLLDEAPASRISRLFGFIRHGESPVSSSHVEQQHLSLL